MDQDKLDELICVCTYRDMFIYICEFAKISAVSTTLTNDLAEIDKLVPQELQGSEVLIEAFNHLGQFGKCVPNLVSPTAPTMFSYVPALQQSIQLVVETLDKILELLGKCSSAIEKQAVENEVGEFFIVVLGVQSFIGPGYREYVLFTRL